MKFRVEINEGGILPGWYYGRSHYYIKASDGKYIIKSVWYIYPFHYFMRLIDKFINMWWEHITWTGFCVICPVCKREYSKKEIRKVIEENERINA